jgi:hypothetical protein
LAVLEERFADWDQEELISKQFGRESGAINSRAKRSVSSIGGTMARKANMLSKGASASDFGSEICDEEFMTPEDLKCKEIKEELNRIDKKLADNGGLNCSWHPADHKDFLRIRTKHGSKTGTVAFMTEMLRALPNLNDEEVRKHI